MLGNGMTCFPSKDGKKMAGTSAKAEETTVAAVKRAIFHDPIHASQVRVLFHFNAGQRNDMLSFTAHGLRQLYLFRCSNILNKNFIFYLWLCFSRRNLTGAPKFRST